MQIYFIFELNYLLSHNAHHFKEHYFEKNAFKCFDRRIDALADDTTIARGSAFLIVLLLSFFN